MPWCPNCKESREGESVCDLCGAALAEAPPTPGEARQKEYLMLLVEETDRARIKHLDRYFAEKMIPCHKKGAWLKTGPSVKFFVPESHYLELCEQLGIQPSPELIERATAAAKPSEPEEDDLPENAAIPKSRWLPLLIIVGIAIAALVLALLFGQ